MTGPCIRGPWDGTILGMTRPAVIMPGPQDGGGAYIPTFGEDGSLAWLYWPTAPDRSSTT